ncbi:MAG: FtsX-like permease family protein, partial [Bacteroidota bacterium]
LQSPLVASVGTSGFLPGMGMGRRPISADNGTSKESQFVYFGDIDYDYLNTMDIELVAGRNYDQNQTADATDKVIVNEAFAKNFGLENPVGERIRYGDSGNPDYKTIIGVVSDFHQSTLHDAIGSQLLLLSPASFHLAVKLQPGSGGLTAAVAHLEESWKAVFPNEVFAYRFLEEDLAQAYETDQIRGRIFLLFSLVTVLIAFLGLFGLVAYIARQRVKEIGIRRVLGASSWNVVAMLSKDFIWLVALAALPAFALAWYFIDNWLEAFAFRVDMNYVLYGSVLLAVLVLVFVTTSLHALRVAGLNPAETLKYE